MTAGAAEVTTEAAHPNQKLADEQAAGLRALADMIQANPELAGPLRVHLKYLSLHISDDKQPQQVFATVARNATKHGAKVTKDYDDRYAVVVADWGALRLQLQTYREEVCERVVVGTETVTKTVKDPALLATVPDVEVTEEVEIVEWQCRPLLAETGAA